MIFSDLEVICLSSTIQGATNINGVAYKQRKLVSPSFGGWEPTVKVPAYEMMTAAAWFADCCPLLCSHMMEG